MSPQTKTLPDGETSESAKANPKVSIYKHMASLAQKTEAINRFLELACINPDVVVAYALTDNPKKWRNTNCVSYLS